MTTSTLRPNATDSAGSIALTGGATLHAVLSDNSDSSYGSIVSGDQGVIQLTTVSLPSGGVTKTVTLRLRAADLVGSSGGIVMQLLNGATVVRSLSVSPTGTITTFADSPFAVTLSQAEVDGLRVYLLNGLVDTCRMYEAYVDLVYVPIPTVSVTGPTGTVTTTTTPTVTWAYTAGADGDVQARYQVRTFTAAQYGAGGFDPTTSAAAHDTGVVVGSATSVAVGPLANSTTYRSYVAVADSINGTLQWSAWTAFTGYSLSLTTADILSVVGTADNTNGRISVVVTRVTAGPPPTWTSVEVQRSDDGGTTWQYVRSANGAAASGTTYTVVDYEAGNGTAALYRARATYLSGGLPITSAWVTSASVTWTAAVDWLKMPSHPSLNRTVTIEANPQLTRPRRQGVLQVLGRSDPVVVSDVLDLTIGTLILITHTDQDATDLLALFAYDVLLLQARPGARFGQKYISIGAIVELPVVDMGLIGDRRWQVPFTEVTAPIDTGVS